MHYDFETKVERKHSGSLKWKEMEELNAHTSDQAIPLSVADMEFKSAPEIYEGLRSFLNHHPILGYTGPNEAFLKAVCMWQKTQHHWEIQKEWIVPTPGVVAAFYVAIQALTQKNDGIMIFRPVYYPFGAAISDNGRKEVNIPLLKTKKGYEIDFLTFENECKKPENKVLIFCSPHNPIGRVWTKKELIRLTDICVKYGIYVISDEIWGDLVSPFHPHTTMATVNEALHSHLITCTAPSKTFNLAGMGQSNIIISDAHLRETFVSQLASDRLDLLNALGYETTQLAYTKGIPWLKEVKEVIYDNMEMVESFFKEHYPTIKAPVSEGTYLQWLDFSQVPMTDEQRTVFLQQKAEWFTDAGNIFGEEGKGYERINVALPKACLKQLLEKLVKELKQAGY